MAGLAAVGAIAAAPYRALGEGSVPAQQVAAEIRELTGAHTRMAWIQDGDENVSSWGCGPKTLIMGFDTDDVKGERVIVGDQSGCAGPVFTPDGKGLVFTRIEWGPPLKRHLMYVNFDGSGLREIALGWFAAATIADPKEGFTWIYGLAEVEGGLRFKRVRMDRPEVVESLWDKTDGPGGATVSPDGKYVGGVYNFAAGNAPCGVYEVPNVAWHVVGTGCLPCMLPTTQPHTLFVATGDHRGGNIFASPGDKDHMVAHHVSFADAPLADNKWEVNTPRWSNKMRFVVLSAPYTPAQNDQGIAFPGGEGDPKYRRYYDKVEISIGRLDEGLTKAERWVQVTHNAKGDYLPQAWIDPDGKAGPANAGQAGTKKPATAKTSRGPAWPGDKTGLVFLWENSLAQNEAPDRSGQGRMCVADARDHAIFGRYGVMDLAGGSFVARSEFAADLLAACRESEAFSLEALVRPDRVDADDLSAIMSFSTNGTCDFLLGMAKDKLVMRLQTSARKENAAFGLATLRPKTAQHILVTYKAGALDCYVDGKRTAANLDVKGDLRAWAPAQLVFGDDYAGGRNWPGTLEGIAIYSRALDAKAAKDHAAAYLARLGQRKPAGRVVVEAKLVDVTPNSTPKAIEPYRRLLLVDNYEVAKVVQGTCDGKNIAVARWGILDNKILDLRREKGKIYTLAIEPMDEHAYLDSERTLNTTQDLTLPLYYNVEKPPTTGGRSAPLTEG
jgi:hypothetical protein